MLGSTTTSTKEITQEKTCNGFANQKILKFSGTWSKCPEGQVQRLFLVKMCISDLCSPTGTLKLYFLLDIFR